MFHLSFGHRGPPEHPLDSPRHAEAWLDSLARGDATARHERLKAALDEARVKMAEPTPDFAQALLLVDAAFDGDRRQLLAWYPEALARSPALAERLWVTLTDAVEAMTQAYRLAFAAAAEHAGDRRWHALAGSIGARLVHQRGLALLARMFRNEVAQPSFWADLHALFLRAVGLGIAREVAVLPGDSGQDSGCTIEHDYIHVLLLGLLRAGNLAPAELTWASANLHIWSRELALGEQPGAVEGYVVSRTSATGLQRPDDDPAAPDTWYLDVTPLMREVVHALAAQAMTADVGASAEYGSAAQHIAVLEKTYAALASRRGTDLRRSRRVATAEAADLRVGLAAIVRTLAPADPSLPPMPRTLSWQIVDRSATGLRATGKPSAGAELALGALVAIGSEADAGWRLAVVRRLAREDDAIAAGMSLLGAEYTALALRAMLRGGGVAGLTVDGLDVGRLGPSFPGLELASASNVSGLPEPASLIIPAAEYSSGRKVLVLGAGEPVLVVLGRVIEQQADWVRVSFTEDHPDPAQGGEGSQGGDGGAPDQLH